MRSVNFNVGETILRQGEDGDTAFLIVSGSVEVTLDSGDDVRALGTLSSGEVFGEMSLIEPGPRAATVKALTETECIETSYDEYVASVADNPEAALAFLKTLVRRLRHMNHLVASADPKRRSLREIFHDWQASSEVLESGTRAAAEQRQHEGPGWRVI